MESHPDKSNTDNKNSPTKPSTSSSEPPPKKVIEAKKNWNQDLFGCFNNCGLAIHTFFCPCVVFGRIAEDVGESYNACCFCCLLPVLNIPCWMRVRGRIREDHAIKGNYLEDVAMMFFCGYCSLIQMHEEMKQGGETHGSKHFVESLHRV